MKLPHWAQLLLGLATIILTWVMAEQASGDLTLPAAAVTVLTVVKTVIGILSPSAAASVNAKAALAKAAPMSLLLLVLGIATSGCSWWATNGQVVAKDVGQIGSCILADLFAGVNDPSKIVNDCQGAAFSDVEQLITSLLAANASANGSVHLTTQQVASFTAMRTQAHESAAKQAAK